MTVAAPTGGSLAGRRVLLPRDPARAAGLAGRLRAAGAEVDVAPVIDRAPADDLSALDVAARDLLSGRYTWAAVTSVNAVDALHDAAGRTGGDLTTAPVSWAAVGPATRRALEDAGLPVSLVPAGSRTAAGLVSVFPPPASEPGRVLAPLGDLASPTLADGLTALGWTVDVVTAYRTVANDLPADVVQRLRSGAYDLVVVTSGSVVREVARQAAPSHDAPSHDVTLPPVVAIGEPSADVARACGITVADVAATPTDDALGAAVVRALSTPEPATSRPTTSPPATPRPTTPDTPTKEHP